VRERDTHREREVCVKARALSSLVQSSGSGTTPVSGRELVRGQRAFCEGEQGCFLVTVYNHRRIFRWMWQRAAGHAANRSAKGGGESNP
jgi:hypothetical protein